MIRAGILLAALLSTGALPVRAQPAPFDMSPEIDLRDPAQPSAPAPASVTSAPAPLPQRSEHFLLPTGSFRLTGEESREVMVVYLTQDQASAPARLEFSYLNALVVAPEISNLSLNVNGSEVARRPIASSSAPLPIAIDLPAGLLRQGANTIAFVASQRHRTDCSVSSTYELWTEVDSSSAALSFEGINIGKVRHLADLAAVGADAAGNTTIRLTAKGLDQPSASRAAVSLAQQLVLAMRVPNLHIEQADKLSESAAPGVLDVVLGTADQLPPAMAKYATQAASGPIAALVPLPSGATTLLVSGPDWADVILAVEAILVAAPPSADRPRIDLPHTVPILLGGNAVTLADLGVPTVEFNGRRHSARFQFDLPPDFYANNYGEAQLVLDAAYSSDVQPGSEIDIFTNTKIASATPLLRTDGGLLRDTIIRIPMTNLRPGRNDLEVVVNLNTKSDEVCSPGWTGKAPMRFVFSSSTQFRLPDYARAAALPDLELLTGSAWPYTEDSEVSLAIGHGPEATLTAMTLMARAAAASGKVLPVTIVSESALKPDRNAILVMTLPEMSPTTLGRSGLSRGSLAGNGGEESAMLDQFRTGGEVNAFSDFVDWMLHGFGLSFDDLRILPQSDAPYPAAATGVTLAQAVQPEGGLWTVLTGPDDASMRTGMDRLAVTTRWRQIGGRVSTLATTAASVTTVETRAPVLVQTQPFSFWNLRLVGANWFSGNILVFTAMLGGAAILLMLATALMLGKVGRQK